MTQKKSEVYCNYITDKDTAAARRGMDGTNRHYIGMLHASLNPNSQPEIKILWITPDN